MCVPSDSLVLLEARLLGWWSILHTKSSLMVWQLAWNPQICERDCINTAFMDNLMGIVDSFQAQQVWQLQKTLSSISISSKNDMQKTEAIHFRLQVLPFGGNISSKKNISLKLSPLSTSLNPLCPSPLLMVSVAPRCPVRAGSGGFFSVSSKA